MDGSRFALWLGKGERPPEHLMMLSLQTICEQVIQIKCHKMFVTPLLNGTQAFFWSDIRTGRMTCCVSSNTTA